MLAAAEVWAADMIAIVALVTASISRNSAHEAEPSFTKDRVSLAAASARRAASISMETACHRGVTSVKHFYE